MTDERTIRQILGHWPDAAGEPVTWEPTHDKGTVLAVVGRSGERYFLKELLHRPSAERLEAERRILKHLEQSGVPVAVPLLSSSGVGHALLGERVFTLSPALPSG